MGASESRQDDALDAARKKRANADRLSLAALRSQFTSSPTVTTDQALLTSARFREEERMRADIRRERRLRQQAISERVSAMQDAIANDLAVQHELTLDALEKEMRSEMEVELAEMERSSLASEETRMREQLDLRLSREISNLQNQLEHEHDRRLEEHKATIKQSIEVQLQDEHRRRLALQKERLALEYNRPSLSLSLSLSPFIFFSLSLSLSLSLYRRKDGERKSQFQRFVMHQGFLRRISASIIHSKIVMFSSSQH